MQSISLTKRLQIQVTRWDTDIKLNEAPLTYPIIIQFRFFTSVQFKMKKMLISLLYCTGSVQLEKHFKGVIFDLRKIHKILSLLQFFTCKSHTLFQNN